MVTNKLFNIIKIAATYAGTIMGAGFASGQELTQFFVVYGSMGLVGLLLTGCLFSWLGFQILELSYKANATSYHQLLYYVCGKKIGLVLDSVISIFLFGVLTIMLAGAGTLFRDTFSLPYTAGIITMALCIVLTTLHGLKGITTANLIITPLLTLTIIVIALDSLTHHQLSAAMISIPPQTADLPAPHWLIASLLYLSYNLVMSTTVLTPLGLYLAERPVRMLGSIAGGLLLVLLAGLVTIVVMIHYPQSLEQEIPMLEIASSQHVSHHSSYILIFLAAMYTTGLASLYGCATKLTTSTSLTMRSSIFILILMSLIASQVGFADLIAVIFPFAGYATLWFTCRLFYLSIFPR